MNDVIIGRVILTTASLAVIWYGFFYLFRDLTVDSFRERMFEARDQLFDDAADGLISFTHPAYILLRLTMNGFIRHGHRISLFEMVMLWINLRNVQGKSFSQRYEESLKGLDCATIERLTVYKERMNELVIIQSLAASPLFVVFVLACMLPRTFMWVIRTQLLKYLSTKMSRLFDALDSSALAFGK